MRRADNSITIASNIIEDAKAIASQYPGRCTATLLDVNNHELTTELVKQHDIVISYIPPFLHPKIFKACLEGERNLVTASYISAEMESYDADAKAKGLIFLNEVGVDPGIDIMSTMKIKQDCDLDNSKIVKYESWWGGLPAAEDSDNPLMYKFSWDPKAVFNTSKNPAKFLKDGEIVEIPGTELLRSGTRKKDFLKALNLEGYPNRDSLSFIKAFGFTDCKTFVRGTLRYGGFGLVMRSLHQVGATNNTKEIDHSKVKSMRDLAESLVEDVKEGETGLDEVFKKAHVYIKEDQELASKMISKLTDKEDLVEIIRAWFFFDLFNANSMLSSTDKFPIDAISRVSLPKMSYKDGEKDLIVMKHIFEIEGFNGDKTTLHSTLIATGDKIGSGGFSIMSKTVGYTTAIAVNLILDGKIQAKGVCSPKTDEFFSQILPKLEEDGIRVIEEYM